MRVLFALRQDLLFQFRHGFVYAYGVVTLFYVIGLLNLPEGPREVVTPLLVFSDTGVLGMFFVGGIVLLERSDNLIESLFVTPLRLWDYVLAKTISLTVLALLASMIILIAAHGIVTSLSLFLAATAMTSIIFTCVGLVIASFARSLNHYFFLSILITPVVLFPILLHLGILDSPLFLALPTTATLVLLRAPFSSPSWPLVVYSLGYLACGAALALWGAHRVFLRRVVRTSAP